MSFFVYDSELISINTSVQENQLGLYDRINQQIEKSQNTSSQFISLRDIYIHLKNHHPKASNETLLLSLDAECQRLEMKPKFYALNGECLMQIDQHFQFQSKSSSFEELGKSLPVTLSRVISEIKNDPLEHQSAKKYGFIRNELNQALGMDFPEMPCELRDYEAELAELRAQYEALREKHDTLSKENEIFKSEYEALRVAKKKPHPNAEKYAVVREDVLTAMIWVLFQPKHYINEKQVKRANLPDLTVAKLIEIVQGALPGQQQLVDLVNDLSPLFWPKTYASPLDDRTMKKQLFDAIHRVP